MPRTTTAATAAIQRLAAQRAAADPKKLSQALRTVRCALADHRVTPNDVLSGIALSTADAYGSPVEVRTFRTSDVDVPAKLVGPDDRAGC